jgi:glycosyltransferase involved in cell wall biosynthesis
VSRKDGKTRKMSNPNMTRPISYVVITPAFNEERNIPHTIRSVLSQTVTPLKWVIVDDGSTDATAKIAANLTRHVDWVSIANSRKGGDYDLLKGSEIKAFMRGYQDIKHLQYDLICKLDADISFGPDFFEKLIDKFHKNPRLGIAGGWLYTKTDDSEIVEDVPCFHVRGATKVYRRDCWNDIGGLKMDLGWDALDIYAARHCGWITWSFKDIKAIHHEKTGSKDGPLKGQIRYGRVYYLMGSSPLYTILKALSLLIKFPTVVGVLATLYGYFGSLLRGEGRLTDGALLRYVRKQQRGHLLRSLGLPTTAENWNVPPRNV